MRTTTEQNSGMERVGASEELWLELVRRQVNSLHYGVVQIVVHGSRVVQIERTEKVRLSDPIASGLQAV